MQTARSTPTFSKARKIRFGHTDSAGIVYYPHCFDRFTATVEDFFDECVGASFQEMNRADRVVTPLRHVECDFMAPSRIGDRLVLTLRSLGRTSVALEIEGSVQGHRPHRRHGQQGAVAPPAHAARRDRARRLRLCSGVRDEIAALDPGEMVALRDALLQARLRLKAEKDALP